MDANGYPDDDELDKIANWPAADAIGLLRYVKHLWKYPEYWNECGTGCCQISTGGWSGNEDLIAAMEKNRMWWLFHWHSSKRGGHYEFRACIPTKSEAVEEPCDECAPDFSQEAQGCIKSRV